MTKQLLLTSIFGNSNMLDNVIIIVFSLVAQRWEGSATTSNDTISKGKDRRTRFLFMGSIKFIREQESFREIAQACKGSAKLTIEFE
ncbi:hypothetical protein GOP47_0012231 [Adiantum capillus-veneris]|uniref:Uncharacterized protein n=1 Tax=Adiantum capillus-veneris TaxID=13818 RepID=A0A9D4UQM6_ADICA|nr:hypothetical protein GOP47_0012231 [Adiantum capillus-veneris]